MQPPLIPPPPWQRRLFFPLCAVLLAPLLAATSATAQEERTNAKPWIVEGQVSTEVLRMPDKPVEGPATAVPLRVPEKPTEQESLILARVYASQGRKEEAVALYRALIAHGRVQDYRTEAAFQLAGMLMQDGRFRDATLLYLDILNHNPNLPRVRLELARAYFLNRDYEDAQLQFELVKGGELPPEVLDKVDSFLTEIRRKKDWTFDFSLSPVSDSNINQGSGGKEECISLNGMLLCRPLEKKQSGMGLMIGGTVNHYVHFNRDFGLRSTIGLNALEYEGRDFDDYQLFVASGPRFTYDSGEVSVQPMYRKRWYAGRQYNEEYGLRFDIQQLIGRFVLNAGASYAKTRYDDEYIDSFLRGDIRSASLQTRYILNDMTFVQASLGFQREAVNVDAYGSDSWRYGLGAYRVLPYGFSLFGEVSLTETRYHDTQWYVTRDHRIDETRRRDKIWQVFASLSSNLLEQYDITPVLQYAYIKRDSNIWSREYDRQRLNFSFNYRF